MTSSVSRQGAILHRLCPACDCEVLEERTTCPQCNSRLVEIRDEIDHVVGTVIDDRFEVRAKLGQGGMGTVYRAWQKSVGREVAIKLIDQSYSRDAMAVRRFLREARLASQLSQPNTVSVFDFGQAGDGRLFIAMELIRGRTLHEVVKNDGAFSIERCVRVATQICDALEAAHGVGIVHRDLKLENVILLDHPPGRDLIKVLDFGLAKNIRDPGSRATESGIVVGTPRYMSPESATTGTTGPAGDVYSLGVMVGELATGKPMWTGETLPELIAQKLEPRPAIARSPAPLRSLLGKLLDPAPERRPTAEQARALLTAIGTGESSLETPDPDAKETTNLRSPSPLLSEPTRQLTPDKLAYAPTGAPPTVTPQPPERPTPSPASSALGSSIDLDRPPVRRWPVVVVGLGALAAIAVTVVIVVTSGGDERSPARPAATAPAALPDAALPVVAPVDAAPAAVELTTPDAAVKTQVTIRVTSEPAGARVVYRDQPNTTPFAIFVEQGNDAFALTGTLGGRTQTIQVVPDKSKTAVIKFPGRRPAARPATDEGTPF